MRKQHLIKAVLGAAPFLFFGLVFPAVGFSETIKMTPTPEPMEYVIEDIKGNDVQVLEEGDLNWEKAVEGQAVASGDEVKVGKGSEVSLTLESETSLHLAEGSDLKVKKVGANGTGGFFSRLQFMTGRLLADVKKNLQASHSSFEVESNGVVCGVRGTAFEVDVNGDNSEVTTHEGEVEVASGNETHRVTAGNLSAFKAGRFQLLRRLDHADIQRFQRWRTIRQVIRQKRIQRMAAIRNHIRQPWQRKHPKINGTDRNPRKELMKRKLRQKLNQAPR